MSRVRTTVSGTIAPPAGTPAYWTALADSTATLVATGSGSGFASGTTIAQKLPSPLPNYPGHNNNPQFIVQAWNGAAVDQRYRKYGMYGNGGHSDWVGNEAYELSLGEDTPNWRRISDPTPNGSLGSLAPGAGTTGVYADGRPRSMHNCFQVYGDGRIWMPMQNSCASDDGGFAKQCVSFNLDTLGAVRTSVWPYASANPWTVHGVPNTPFDGSSIKFGTAVFDRVRHRAYWLSGESANTTIYGYVSTFGATLGQFTSFSSGQSIGDWRWAVCCDDLGIIVAGDYLRQSFATLNLANPGAGWTIITSVSGTGYFGDGSPNSGPGAVYLRGVNQIAVGDPSQIGSRIYKLVIPTSGGAYNPAGTWAWSNFVPAGPTAPLSAQPSGLQTYSKFNLVEDMGDGRMAIVYCGSHNSGTWVCKVPAAGF